MEAQHRALVAAQPEAWSVLQRLLKDMVDMVPAHTIEDAFNVLDQEAARIHLIITTIAFDESRMVEFLQAVKRNAPMNRIPFLCSRVLPSVLSDKWVESMRDVCTQCGAVDLLDIANLRPEGARSALRIAVTNCLQARSP